MTITNRTLVIMAKAPRPGSVKTRLAQSLSLEAVTGLYRCLLNDTIALAQGLDHVEITIMCPASDVEDLARAVGKTVRVVAQTGQGLAAGLASVFAHFAPPGHRRAISVHTDHPHPRCCVSESAHNAPQPPHPLFPPTSPPPRTLSS